MRAARVVTTLVLAAHGSADPRSAANTRAVANQIRFMRPGLRVRVAFCDLNTPRLVDVVTPDAVVTPFLLADAYHARIDIPRQIAGGVFAPLPFPQINTSSTNFGEITITVGVFEFAIVLTAPPTFGGNVDGFATAA